MRTSGLDTMFRTLGEGVKNYTAHGQCSNCGECCSNLLPISEREIKEIRRYIRVNDVKEHKHNGPTMTPTLDLTCPFRNDAKQCCDIYPVRPFICRDFKCDKSQARLLANIDKYDDDTRCVNMREMFFPVKTNKRKAAGKA